MCLTQPNVVILKHPIPKAVIVDKIPQQIALPVFLFSEFTRGRINRTPVTGCADHPENPPDFL